MKIASIQLNICWENKHENFIRAEFFVKKAVLDGCDLVVFPEMFNTGFSMNSVDISESPGGETTQFLCQLAHKYDVNLIAGFSEKKNDKSENIALFVSREGKLVSRYVKNYPYSPSGEKKFYLTGDKQVVFALEDTQASMFICYDLRFPELFRQVARDVSIIFIIASWPVARQDHWETLLKARAIENQCFVVGVNRIGSDGNNLQYGGGSHVYSPLGENLSYGRAEQEYIVTDIDLKEVDSIRSKLPFLDDMKL